MAHLSVIAVPVNHIVPTVGLVVSDGKRVSLLVPIRLRPMSSGRFVNEMKDLDALLIEASFPDRMAKLAEVSRHFTPASLNQELKKLNHNGMDIMAVHLKPTYRDEIIEQLKALNIPKLSVMEPGKVYTW